MKKEYEFSSERLFFRTIKESDSKQISVWRSDDRIIRFFKNPTSVSEIEQINWYNNSYLNDYSRYDFIVFYDDNPVGFVSLTDIHNDTAEVGYAIGEVSFQKKKLSKEMIEAICSFGSKEFNISRFAAIVHRNNIASIKAASSAGFSIEGEEGDFIVLNRLDVN